MAVHSVHSTTSTCPDIRGCRFQQTLPQTSTAIRQTSSLSVTRPKYAALIWDPFLTNDMNVLEAVQERAAAHSILNVPQCLGQNRGRQCPDQVLVMDCFVCLLTWAQLMSCLDLLRMVLCCISQIFRKPISGSTGEIVEILIVVDSQLFRGCSNTITFYCISLKQLQIDHHLVEFNHYSWCKTANLLL